MIPILQSVFQSLTDYGFVMRVSQVNYLQENNTIAQRFKTYLASNNSLVKSQNANMGINFFMDNPNNLFSGNTIDETTQDLYEIIYMNFGIKNNNTAANNESLFLSFLQTNKTGLKLLKGDATFSNWQLLNKDSNGNVIPQNCP